jgi:hypothetical protein
MKSMDINDFILSHNEKYIAYCEAILRADGTILYAEPSHLYALQMIYGIPYEELFEGGPLKDKLFEEMPQIASPVHWLSEVLNCVVLWYNTAIFPPNYTQSQIESYKKLKENGCIDKNSTIEISMEYQICEDNVSLENLEMIYNYKKELKAKLEYELDLNIQNLDDLEI